MDIDRTSARDYVIHREGEALLAADPQGAIQLNPECANDILRVDADTGSSEFNDIHLDSYTEDCVANIRDQNA